MRKNTFFARFAQHLVLFTTCLMLASCTTEIPSGSERSEGEGESERAIGDQCPGLGCRFELANKDCTTDRECAAVHDCSRGSYNWCCTDYTCDTNDGSCYYRLVDRDGDGFVSPFCGGSDCYDGCDPELFPSCKGAEGIGGDIFYPGAPEIPDGFDNDCDGQTDEREGDDEKECLKTGFNAIAREGNIKTCESKRGDYKADYEPLVEPDNQSFETAPLLQKTSEEESVTYTTSYAICWPGDVDIYRWLVLESYSHRICIEFEHDEGDIDAALYDSDLNLVDLAQSCNDNEELTIPAGHEGEIWYIVVNGWGDATNLYYFLQNVTRLGGGGCPAYGR